MKNIKPNGTRLKGYFIFHISIILLSFTSGCGNKFFDPSQVGRFDHTPAVNVILEKLGPAEEIPVGWELGEEPRPLDTIAVKSDYTLMSGDYIEIEIPELLSRGIIYSKNYEVSETGKVSIPIVGEIIAKGKTERQLEEMIKNKLSPDILIDPIVHVTFLQSQHRAFSIQGDGIREPNRYPILKNDWRLRDTLAQARGVVSQQNVSFVYVTRRVPKKTRNSDVSKNDIKDFRAIESEYNLKEPITLESTPRTQTASNSRISKLVVSSSEMVIDNRSSRNVNRYRYPTAGRLANKNAYQFSDMPGENSELENPVSVDEVLKRVTGQSVKISEVPENGNVPQQNNVRQPEVDTTSPEETEHTEWVFQNGEWVAVKVVPSNSNGLGNIEQGVISSNNPETTNSTSDDEYEWVLEGGKWIPAKPGQTTDNNTGFISQPDTGIPGQELAWDDEYETETRLIKIPIDKLMAGVERYNIVIKPGDCIHVPLDVAGVYYLMGNLNRTGAVEMTGGMVTLKQAVATAGNIGPLGWPKRCEITRRIGRNKEEIVRVDLEKIFNGEQPDIYIKPHDIINVGTHATSIWRAVLRNSFRATYGFGFAYDRNFANDAYYTSKWFD
ncbi:MAG: polysaccharide biosynthesis/export family protein [Sedimentisphaerales bacterium]|nr:polysaccharide biosynthesis/export family protein [Sedimentisphaerales bacterium]